MLVLILKTILKSKKFHNTANFPVSNLRGNLSIDSHKRCASSRIYTNGNSINFVKTSDCNSFGKT